MLAATFQPQQWVNDYAVDSGPSREFDAGHALLQLRADTFQYVVAQAHASSGRDLDALAEAASLVGSADGQHPGPFCVSLDEDELDAFLSSLGIEDVGSVRDCDLEALRAGTPASGMRM